MALQPLAEGDPPEIAGYRLQARLGGGGMGVVYLAYTALGLPVAIKVLRPELGDDPAFRERFRHEVAAARRVSGQFTAQVLDADPDAVMPWVVTAYVSGPSLAQAVAERGPLPADSVLWLVRGVAGALAVIHAAGVVHRDLKPSNVLLAADGPRVIDFGIARAVEAAVLTQTGTRLGSPPFMAPEQARGEDIGPAADVWALGGLGCFAATGRAPFGSDGGDPTVVLFRVLHQEPNLEGCPAEVREVLAACLARDPAARPSASQVAEQCRAAEEGSAGQPAGGSWLPPALAADLVQYAPPAAGPASAPEVGTVPGLRPGLGPVPVPGPAWGTPFAAGQPAMPVPGPGDTGTVSLGLHRPPPGAGPAGPSAALAMPPADSQPGKRITPRMLAALMAATAVLSAGLTYGAVALTGHGGGKPQANGGTSGKTHNVSRPSSPAATASSGLDSCLFGTWRQTLEQIPDTINGDPITLSGGYGMIETFSPSGVATMQYGGGITYTATLNGNVWSEVINGSATYDYTTQDGMLLSSNVIANGTQALDENGSYDNGGPLTLNTEPARYTCSGNTLKIFSPNGDNENLTRE
jgi:hypothetical protein